MDDDTSAPIPASFEKAVAAAVEQMHPKADTYQKREYRGCVRAGIEIALKAFAAFADEKGEPKLHCVNCGTWWNREGRCPLCMGTHAEMGAAKKVAEAALKAEGEGKNG